MSQSDFEQDLEGAMEICRLEKATLHPSGADVKVDACSREGGENKGKRNETSTCTTDMSGKARRKKRRLRNEPESIIGELL